MTDETQPRRGRTTIAPDVLVSIARLTALSVPGIVRMSPVPVAMDRLFNRSPNDGVRIEVRQHAVLVDLYVVTRHDVNVREVCSQAQTAVARAIQEMVGMSVLTVNVYVEDVAFTETPAP